MTVAELLAVRWLECLAVTVAGVLGCDGGWDAWL